MAGEPVKVLLYDLSQGMAQQFSAMMPGLPSIVPHTSVVVFKREFYFGGSTGLDNCVPGTAPYGRPVKEIPMGITQLNHEDVMEILNSLQSHYSAESYSLLDHNCNNFSNDFCNYLTGQSIPKWILSAPDDFMATPLGQSLRPMIDEMYSRPVTQANGSKPDAAQAVPQIARAAAEKTDVVNGGNAPEHTRQDPLILESSLSGFQAIVRSTTCVIGFFTSATCPPCRLVEPTFRDLAWKHCPIDAKGRVTFVKVDMHGKGQQIGQAYGVRATPTFIFWQNGKEVNRFSGADSNKLISETELELMSAFPPHQHAKIQVPELNRIELKPIIFDAQPKSLAPLFDKLRQNLPETWTDDITTRLGMLLSSTSDENIKLALDEFMGLLNQLEDRDLFPLFDLLRLGFISPNSRVIVTELLADETAKLLQILSRIASVSAIGQDDTAMAPSRLTSLKMLCNCFAHDQLVKILLDRSRTITMESLNTTYGECIVGIVHRSLLSSNEKVRQPASSLCFDIVDQLARPVRTRALLHAERRHAQAGKAMIDATPTQEEACNEDWAVEMVSMLNEALGSSLERLASQSHEKPWATEFDILYRLVASLGCLVYQSPFAQVLELVSILNVKSTLEQLQGHCQGAEARDLKGKVGRLLIEIIALCPE